MRGRSRTPWYMRRSLVSLAALVLFPFVSAAQTTEGLRIELNKLEPMESACRAYLLFQNGTSSSFDSLKLDLVMFDPDGVINRRLAVEGGPLPAGKTSVKLFDVQDVSCTAISRVLLNGVLNCSDAEGDKEDCLELVETATRSSAEFFK